MPRFIVGYLEAQAAMALGALVCLIVGGSLRLTIALAGAVAQNDLSWLVYAMYPAMSLMIVVYMLYEREMFWKPADSV